VTGQLTAADVRLMQGLAQRVTATHPELVNAETTFGELAWNWGKEHPFAGATWPCKLWSDGGELVAWGWAHLPRRVRRADGSVRDITGARLTYQVHPGHAGLIDEVIGWYDEVAAGLDRTVVPVAGDEYARRRWAAHGYVADDSDWTQLNARDLVDVPPAVLPPGFRFRTAAEADPAAVVQAHLDAWAPSTYSAEAYAGVRVTAGYRPDLHLLVEAPDGTMAASTIMWLDEVNRSAEFEPVGTHPDHRRQGLARAMLLHGMHRARSAGATAATVACLGMPERPSARELYHSLGFREISRDAPLVKTFS
jgi:ribosomal protein S18 acetylase RimI-like enzyme